MHYQQGQETIFPPPGGDFESTWNPACFVLDPFLSLSFSLFFFFNEQTPLRATAKARSNQSQPPWDTNASHSDRYAAAYDHLCSFPPVPHLLWECSHSEVSQLSLWHLFSQDLSDKLLQNLPHFWIVQSSTVMTAVLVVFTGIPADRIMSMEDTCTRWCYWKHRDNCVG